MSELNEATQQNSSLAENSASSARKLENQIVILKDVTQNVSALVGLDRGPQFNASYSSGVKQGDYNKKIVSLNAQTSEAQDVSDIKELASTNDKDQGWKAM